MSTNENSKMLQALLDEARIYSRPNGDLTEELSGAPLHLVKVIQVGWPAYMNKMVRLALFCKLAGYGLHVFRFYLSLCGSVFRKLYIVFTTAVYHCLLY